MIGRTTLYKVPGGDTVQTLETAEALRGIGIEVDVRLTNESIDYKKYDLIHFFNIIRPHNIQKHINKAKLPYVISPIFVDYSEIEKKHSSFAVRFLYSLFGSDGISYLKVLARYLVNGENIGDFKYLLRGQKRAIEKILSKTDLLLPNSISEYNRLKLKYKFNTDYMVVPNAVSKDFYKKINLSQKQETVLCIARIELVKNQ